MPLTWAGYKLAAALAWATSLRGGGERWMARANRELRALSGLWSMDRQIGAALIAREWARLGFPQEAEALRERIRQPHLRAWAGTHFPTT